MSSLASASTGQGAANLLDLILPLATLCQNHDRSYIVEPVAPQHAIVCGTIGVTVFQWGQPSAPVCYHNAMAHRGSMGMI